MRELTPLPSISDVGPGNDSSLNLPLGKTYEMIQLEYSGKKANGVDDVTPSDLQNIEVQVNGKVIQAYKDGNEIDVLNQFYGRGAANGFLNLWFIRPELENIGGMWASRLTALGTADIQTLTLHFHGKDDLTSLSVKAHAVKNPVSQPMGLITKVRAFPRSFATSGQQEIDNIPRSGARIAAMHLFKSDVSDVELTVDQRNKVDASKALLEEYQIRVGKRTPQTAVATHIDFLINGDIEDALATKGVQDFRVKPTLDTNGDVRTVVEYLDYFAGI